MALEEDAPRNRRRAGTAVLDSLGIDELRLYIEELKTEIAGLRPISAARTATAAPPTLSSSSPKPAEAAAPKQKRGATESARSPAVYPTAT